MREVSLLGCSERNPAFIPERRRQLFADVIEPSLQRELKHRGAANGDGSYAVELIGYLE